MTIVGVPHSLAWSALAPELRAISGMSRDGKRQLAVGAYARFIEVVGARSMAVAPPDGWHGSSCASVWQKIGQRLRGYCSDSYVAAYDAASRVLGGAAVEPELARFTTLVASYPLTQWVQTAEGKWVTPARAAELAWYAAMRAKSAPQREADAQAAAAESTALARAQRATELEAGGAEMERAREHLAQHGREALLDRWGAIGRALFDEDPRRFIRAFNFADSMAEGAFEVRKVRDERAAALRDAGVIDLFGARHRRPPGEGGGAPS